MSIVQIVATQASCLLGPSVLDYQLHDARLGIIHRHCMTRASCALQVCISVLYGESSLASNNRLLGQFDIVNLPSAAAGVPQIEVTFNLSADLQLTVLARDLDSGRQKIWEQGGGAVVQKQGC